MVCCAWPRKTWWDAAARRAIAHGRTRYLPEIAYRPESGAGHVLVVRLWPIKEPAILRWFARGNRTATEAGRNHSSQNGRLVRVQAFQEHAVLRWHAQPAQRSETLEQVFSCAILLFDPPSQCVRVPYSQMGVPLPHRCCNAASIPLSLIIVVFLEVAHSARP
jgi:hypothetical protein